MILLLTGTMILPILLAVSKAFYVKDQFSLFWFSRLLEDETGTHLLNGLALACATTMACLLLSVPLAVLRARTRFFGQGLLGVAVLLPLILPPFVGAMAIKSLLGQYGAVNQLLIDVGIFTRLSAPDWLESGFWGVVILQALHLFPILYLNASAALANIDPAFAQAARNLGAGPVRTFFGITLPLMRPGLFAGGTIVFIWSFTDIGTPIMLGYRPLLPVTLFDDLTGSDYTGKTFALVVVLLTVSVGLYVLGKFFFGRQANVGGSKATIQSDVRPLGAVGTALAWLAFGGVLLLAVLPHIGVILNAFSANWTNTVLPVEYTTEHLRSVVSDRETYRSITNSLQYAGVSTFVDLLLGSIAAWLIVRARPLGAGLLDAMVMLPLAVPGVILAAGYVAMTVPGSLLAGIGPQNDPFALLVIAYSVRRLPFVVRGVSAGLQQVPESLEEAARNLGCSATGTARRITLPLVMANMIAAAVLAFSFAMLEVSDSLVLAQRPGDYPITKQIYDLFTSGTGDSANVAAALGVYGMVLLGGTMAAASLLLGKRLGAVFRA